jgi:ABC-type dipeptide/oligopeptide/nickel transport system ATPase component
MANLLLSVKGLCVQYFDYDGQQLSDQLLAKNNIPQKKLLKEIVLSVYHREKVGVLGESGAGKSLTVKSLLGLIDIQPGITRGSIHYYPPEEKTHRAILDKWEGADGQKRVRNTLRDWKKNGFQLAGKNIAMVMQDPRSFLHPYHSIKKALYSLNVDIQKEETIALLNKLRLNNEEFLSAVPAELSGGQAQRAMILLGAQLAPVLLIADEPTTGLDLTTKRKVVDLLRNKDSALLFISHDINMVRHITSWIYVMYNGQIIEANFAKSFLKTDQHHPYTKSLLQELSGEALYELNGVDDKMSDSQELCPFLRYCPEKKAVCFQKKPRAFGINTKNINIDEGAREPWARCWNFYNQKET